MPPIFIVGSGRSGTSLLRALLNAHPDVHLGQETALVRWMDRWPELSGAAFVDAWRQTAAGALFQPDPVQVPATATPADAVAAVLQARAARFGRTRWGDKTPLHALHLPQIWAAWPTARVVAMTRHPVPTVASLRRMPWSSGSLITDAVLVEQALRALPNDERLLRVKLEDLLADPPTTLRAVLAHLDVPWSDQVLDHPAHAPFSADPRVPWLTGAERPLRVVITGPSDLSPQQVSLIQAICPPTRHGYAPWTRPAAAGWALEAARQLPRALGFAGKMVAMPSTRPGQSDPRAQLRWLLSLNPDAAAPELADRVLP
jgi:hypothetical protein